MESNRRYSVFYKFIIFFAAITFTGGYANSQEVMMQGWYWDYPKTADGNTWADTIREKASVLGDAGFTYVWLPPVAKASSGAWSNGYDPKDLFDYGEYGATGYGTRTQLDQSIAALGANGVKGVADVVFNHRDGGSWEDNAGLENYVDNYSSDMVNAGANPFPYDRMRNVIPIGGTTGLGAGTYYIKVSSASQNSKYDYWEYKIYMHTDAASTYNGVLNEVEPNGGGVCSEASQIISLGYDYNCQLDAVAGCATDEFALTLTAADFNAAGDHLYIYWGNRNSGYSDARIYGIWFVPEAGGGSDIVDQMRFQTMTDFSAMPSGRGAMHWNAFKPNNDRATSLEGDWDGMYFYYDYDQFQQVTKDTLFEWAKWNWQDVGMRGFRMDAVKHFTPEFVGDMLDYLHDNNIDPGLVVGEWYSTGTAELAGWVNDVYAAMDNDTKSAISPKIFDFALRESLRQACDGYGYDVRNVFSASLHDAQSLSGNNVITFINNHDFRDESEFASLIQNDPMLAYAYILTNNQLGLPSVFYPDYFGYPDDGTAFYPSDKSAHKDDIDELLSIHKSYIYGSSEVTYLNAVGSGYANDLADNSYVMVYQLNGTENGLGSDVVVAINFGGSQVQFHQQVKDMAVGTTLTDIPGHSANPTATVQTEENGVPNDIWIDLPARSYTVWVEDLQESKIYVPGSHNDWDLDLDNEAYLKEIGGDSDYYGKTLFVDNDQEFKLVDGSFSTAWGGGYWINSYNQRWDINYSGGNAIWKNLPAASWVHLCLENPALHHDEALPLGIMRLSEQPASIATVTPIVSHDVTAAISPVLNISLSDDAAAEEKVYVRYTDDAWATSHIVQATGAGTSFAATLPTATALTERVYYVLTSTADLTAVEVNPDLLTINYDINGGDNFYYMVPDNSSDACLRFDGDGAYVKVTDLGELDPQHISLEAWIRPQENASAFQPVISRNYAPDGPADFVQFSLGITADDQLYLAYDDVNGARIFINSSSDAIRRDAWNHIACTQEISGEENTVTLYVNGLLVAQSAALALPYSVNAIHETYVGRAFLGQSYFFKGDIDEVKMWSASRIEAEVRNDMTSYPEGSETNLLMYLPFEEKSGTTTKDYTTHNYDGTFFSFNGSSAPQFYIANLPAIWTGAESGIWNSAGNWGWHGRVPTNDDDLMITSWAANSAIVSSSLRVKELILFDHNPITVSPGNTLTVTEGVYFKTKLRIGVNSDFIIHSGLGL